MGACRATHRVGGIFTYVGARPPLPHRYIELTGLLLPRLSGANPAYTVDELVSQIQTAKATVLFIHPDCRKVGLEAARKAGIRDDRVALFDGAPDGLHVTVSDLVKEGLAQPKRYVEPQLKPGEGKTKLALLLFSSGTTGRPKAVMIPHYAVIANCVQMKQWADMRDAALPDEKKLYEVGDIGLGGMFAISSFMWGSTSLK